MANSLPQNFPNPAGPFVEPDTGRLTDAAQNFLQTLFQRTGGTSGDDTTDTSLLANGALQKQACLSDVQSADRARRNLGLTSAALAAPVDGWTAPTGTGSRAAIDGSYSGGASATYTQAELQAAQTQLAALSKALAAVIRDLETYGAIGP